MRGFICCNVGQQLILDTYHSFVDNHNICWYVLDLFAYQNVIGYLLFIILVLNYSSKTYGRGQKLTELSQKKILTKMFRVKSEFYDTASV